MSTEPLPEILDDGLPATGNPDYDQLPRGVKDLHSLEQWLWLSDSDKASLVQTETEPDY